MIEYEDGPDWVRCPECGWEQSDMGRGVQCEECGYGPMPTKPRTTDTDKESE